MTAVAPATVSTQPSCQQMQIKLGITNPLPMWGFHWIESGRHFVRVYDSRTQAEQKQFEALNSDPQRYANSWIEAE